MHEQEKMIKTRFRGNKRCIGVFLSPYARILTRKRRKKLGFYLEIFLEALRLFLMKTVASKAQKPLELILEQDET